MPAGLLIVGAYGTGKTSVCEEIAEALESAGIAYGAIDLDWLSWYDSPGRTADHDRRDAVAMANLSAVVENYLGAGVERFVFAGAVWSEAELAAIRSTLPFSVRVVQLTVPYEQIEARLSPALTTGRAKDLEEARHQSDIDPHLAELVVANDRSVRDVAQEILAWMGWP